VRLSPLGMSATDYSIIQTPDHRWVCSLWWNDHWQGKPKYLKNTCSSSTLFTSPIWLDPGSKSGLHGGKPATNRLSYGTV
jgi:hypothetical protein